MKGIHIKGLSEKIPYPIGLDSKKDRYIMLLVAKNIKPFLKKDVKYDLIGRGSSGAILCTLLSIYLGEFDIRIKILKKEGEKSHHNNNGYYFGNEIIIVDDFISSGETINIIYSTLLKSKSFNKVFMLITTSLLLIKPFTSLLSGEEVNIDDIKNDYSLINKEYLEITDYIVGRFNFIDNKIFD